MNMMTTEFHYVSQTIHLSSNNWEVSLNLWANSHYTTRAIYVI